MQGYSQTCNKNNTKIKDQSTSKQVGFSNATHAETSAATETLYGCFALQRYPIMHKGNAPYPTRSPANPMPMFSRNVRNNFI